MYYVYISDTKVDMLFAQIPTNILKKISAGLKINLGVISVDLKERKSEYTRYDKAKVVSNYIENHLEVGDIDNPKTYFKGTVSMRWIRFNDWRESQSLQKSIVYFSGETERTTLVLAGSTRHIIGVPPNDASDTSMGSYTPDILNNFAKFARQGVDIQALQAKSPKSDSTLSLINEVSILA